jgi:large subunit ribosomal protein L30
MTSRKARRKQAGVEELRRTMSARRGATSRTYRVTLTGSEIGGTERQRATLRCLGLGKRGSLAMVPDTPQSRGRIRAVAHLIAVEEA